MASLALTTSGLPPPTGVSVNISTEFLRPGGTEGDELVLESEVLKLGMSLSFLVLKFDLLVRRDRHLRHLRVYHADAQLWTLKQVNN